MKLIRPWQFPVAAGILAALLILGLGSGCDSNSNEVASHRTYQRPPESAPDSDDYLAESVHVEFSKSHYQFTSAEIENGITIDYRIVVTEDVSDIVVVPQDFGECDVPGHSGLIRFEKLFGNKQMYGIFDRGLCPPATREPTTIREGKYEHQFKWDGHNWTGPSDTNQPKGKKFPPGQYVFEVSFCGITSEKDGRKPFRDAYAVMVEIVE